MSTSLRESIVLITGATTGIGRATALAFAREGARIVVSGREAAAGGILEAELLRLGTEALFVQADIRREVEVAELVERTVARFGRLDVAVNNAGTEGMAGAIVDVTEAGYTATFETNVLGTLLCMKHELRAMLPRGRGSVVNLSSGLGRVGAPGVALYSASKHAIEGMTKCAALECAAAGVRVNAVAPGPIDTDMLTRFTGTAERKAGLIGSIPAGRAGSPQEVAEAIVFIASARASFITGESLAVDGGILAA